MRSVDQAGMPAAFSVRTHLMDHLLHGWDLAAATGQPREAPEHLIAMVEEIVDSVPAVIIENPRVFGPRTAARPEAAVFDQLATHCGRQLPG